MRALSIRSRLTAAYAAVFALIFVVAGIGAMVVVSPRRKSGPAAINVLCMSNRLSVA